MTRRNNLNNSKSKRISISRSGKYSKRIAEELKIIFEEYTFFKSVSCFVSTQDIASGEDWYNKIKSELKKSSLGIMIITKENVKAPWLYFEAGAMIGNYVKVIPLLVNCDQQSLEKSPIRVNQCVQFYEPERFKKMLSDIDEMLSINTTLNKDVLENIYRESYEKMKTNLKPILEELKSKRYFSERYIYPNDINTITMDTVYISAPMSTLTDGEYVQQQCFLKNFKHVLFESRNFSNVYCPAIDIETNKWQGITTAVKDNFNELRQVQHLIVIYPKSVATSSLVEIGYGIALCKNVLIFYKEELPFMLKGSAEDIPHLNTRKYEIYEDIITAVMTDRSLFEVKRDE